MAELGAAPIGERVEFLSDAWLEAAEALLRRSVRTFADELRDVRFSLCEIFSNAPPHLRLPDNVAAWTFRLDNGDVSVRRGVDPAAEFRVEGDYQRMLPVAQAVGSIATGRALAQARHLWGQGWVQVRGQPPSGRLGEILSALHDHLARRTVENPDLDHRIARQGLERHVAELAEQGYTVIERAISEDLNAEMREACLAATADHRAVLPANGRIDTNGLLGAGRVFEEIVQHPLLRTVAESSLGAGMILHTVGSCVTQPGPAVLGMHADYVAVPDPFPEFALVGVSVWAFDDWDGPDAGPTWIRGGSHRRRRQPRPDDSREGGVPILMPKGSVTFFTQGVWHWQGDRTRPGQRVSMHNAYARAFVRQADDFAHLEHALHRNSPVLSTLAGRDDYFGRTSYRGHDFERMGYMNKMLGYDRRRARIMA